LTHLDTAGFAASLRDRSHAGQGAQGVVISRLDGLMSLHEQRGEDNPSHPRQGAQDCRVALLGILPGLGLRSGKLFDQAVDPPRDGLDLVIDQVEALRNGRDVDAGRIGRSWRDCQRRPTQDGQGIVRSDSSDTMGCQHPRDFGLGQAHGFGRGWRLAPKCQEPVRTNISGQIKHLRIVAPELLPHAVRQPDALLLQFFGPAA
jgi:hypothetical protein